MKIKFENLKYQNDATNSAVDVFKGQKLAESQFTVSTDYVYQSSFTSLEGIGIANSRNISNKEMLKNVRQIQLRNEIPQSNTLWGNNDRFPQFNIEMETGTGKTYVYFKTILELNKKYGFKKFIIVVPSVAIKEGVLKTYRMTHATFASQYHGVIYNVFDYDSNQLSRVQQFAMDNTIDIMVLTMSSINKGNWNAKDKKGLVNVVYRENDLLQGQKPIDLIASTNPILILDEPQALDNTDLSKQAINNLNPLAAFRYSATHRDKSYPTIYRLNAVDAYEKQLVKQIEVASVTAEEHGNKAFIHLKEVSNKGGKLKAKVEVYVKGKDDSKKKSIWVKQYDNLLKKTKLPIYETLGDIEDIDATPGQEAIYLTGQPAYITLQESNENDLEEKRQQIRLLIKSHLNKELKLNQRGIKVLSLIFIDKVANYRIYKKDGSIEKGPYAKIFEEEYEREIVKPRYSSLIEKYDIPIDEIHQGYFAKDGKGHFKNSSKGESAADESEYQLIMEDKEGLLTMYDANKHTSSANKTRFIFSHSALKEGWDNPNIFQIATLVETKDPITKRQKIGRGLRIAVDQDGKRVPGFNVNTLTVIANESYDVFAKDLQHEYEEDGEKFGIFTDDVFSTIITCQNDNYEDSETLGREASKELIDELKTQGYIDSKGHGTPEFKEAINNGELNLSDKFKAYEDDIITISKKYMTTLNIKDARRRVDVRVNKEALSDNFLALWNRIKYRTRYRIKFDSDKFIEQVVKGASNFEGINSINVIKSRYKVSKTNLKLDESGVAAQKSREYNEQVEDTKYQLPDIVSELQNATHLTRNTIVAILKKADNLDQFKINPISYMTKAAACINALKNHIIINGIEYIKTGEAYDQKLFNEETLTGYLGEDGNTVKVDTSLNKTVYDYVVTDSDVEKEFAEALENDEDVKFYIKLPDWFKIPTPLGSYNPDWAIFKNEDEGPKLYFIIETKGNTAWNELRPDERAKINAGEQSFAALDTGLIFKKVTKEDELN